MKPTPAGFRVINTWGSARYNCAAQLCALVMRKYTGRAEFGDWARGQMNYIMGNNPMNRSYIVGFPTPAAAAQHPHHRAAHGSTTNNQNNPATHRHVLWGALVGGPDSTDFHRDETTDFVFNEVAVDYNAGLVGALAGLYTYYGAGQAPLANFPPAEPVGQPYFNETKLEQENTERSQVTIRVNALPVHPPQFETTLSARYFFDISELIAAGQTIADVRIEIYYDQEGTASGHPTLVSALKPWDGGSVYYVEFAWTGAQIYGTREIQFGLIARQDAQFHSNWNPTNDWSHQGIAAAYAVLPHVTLYRGGALVFGQEPPSSPVANYSLSATPAALTVTQGASVTDAVSILRTNGFTGAVALSVSGLPAGVTASIVPATTTGAAATLTLTAATTATLGTSVVTINGTGTPGARTATLSLTVSPPTVADFSLTATPATLSLVRGATGTTAISIARTGGFAEAVTLSAAGLPAGVTATFSPNPATGNSSTLTLAASATATLGAASVTINGTSTTATRTRSLGLTVSDIVTTPCTNPTTTTLPLVQNGAGEFCWVTSGTVSFINSWNMQKVEVNGIDFTNKWSNSMPPRINGNYYIHYLGAFSWSHLEVNGTP
jgi:CBS domain-containing protein